MKTKYLFFNNTDQQVLVEELIRDAFKIRPYWLNELIVSHQGENPDGEGADASISGDKQYLLGRLTLYSVFFRKDKEKQLQILIHECIHLFLFEYTDWVDDVLLNCTDKDNKPLQDMLARQRRTEEEEVVSGLAASLWEYRKGE